MTASFATANTHPTRTERPFGDLAETSSLGVTASVNAGGTILVEGDPIDHYFRILSGTVRLYNAVADGRRQIIDFLGPDDCFGLTGLAAHAYSVEAITDVVFIRCPRYRLEAAIDAQPDLARDLFRLACTELGQAQRRMLLLGRKSAEERLASFLLDLAKRQGDQLGPDQPVKLDMSRQDIADHLGLTIETVSRIFTRFKRAGLISLPDRHDVVLKQVDKLVSMAEGGLAA